MGKSQGLIKIDYIKSSMKTLTIQEKTIGPKKQIRFGTQIMKRSIQKSQ